MAKWGKHITLIFIFWLFDNRQPLVLFPQPSNRPYLHIAGLIDFSPERMHYSQVINCLKLFLNENAGNLWCSFLNGDGGGGQDNFQTARIRDFFPPQLIDSFFTSSITNLQRCSSDPRTDPIHVTSFFCSVWVIFFLSPTSSPGPMPPLSQPPLPRFLFPQHIAQPSSPESSSSSSDYYIINNNL